MRLPVPSQLATVRPSPPGGRARRIIRSRAGFTLAEVLAALLFMAIVIPVAIQGVRVASQAGLVAQRKPIAMRHAERLLNEALLTTAWESGVQSGTLDDGNQVYRWRLHLESWEDGVLQLVTLQVLFPVQGEDYDVQLSTVVDTSL